MLLRRTEGFMKCWRIYAPALTLLCLLVAGVQEAFPFSTSESSQLSPQRASDTLPQSLEQSRSSISTLREQVRVNPGQADLHVALGRELEAMGNLSEAIAEYAEALRLQPNHAQAFYSLSQARRAERELDESRHAMGSVADERQDLKRDRLSQARDALSSGEFPLAVTLLREGREIDPNDPQIRLSLGRALLNMADVDGAIEEFRAVVRIQPELPEAHLRLATALMVKRDWAAAEAELTQAIRLDPELIEAHYSLGAVRYTQGDLVGAVASYRYTLSLSPDFPDAHYRLGLILKVMGEEHEAAQAFLMAAESGIPQAQYFLGTAYRNGLGADKNLSAAIGWWMLAAEQGVSQAREALIQLRKEALSPAPGSSAESRLIVQAFDHYREGIWSDYPELSRERIGQSVGARLLEVGRPQEAVPILIKEAGSLSDRSQVLLEALYEEGVDGQLPAYDRRILAYFQTAAAEGLPRPRSALARIYELGLGVEPDRKKALMFLESHPDRKSRRLPQSADAAGTKPHDPWRTLTIESHSIP